MKASDRQEELEQEFGAFPAFLVDETSWSSLRQLLEIVETRQLRRLNDALLGVLRA